MLLDVESHSNKLLACRAASQDLDNKSHSTLRFGGLWSVLRWWRSSFRVLKQKTTGSIPELQPNIRTRHPFKTLQNWFELTIWLFSLWTKTENLWQSHLVSLVKHIQRIQAQKWSYYKTIIMQEKLAYIHMPSLFQYTWLSYFRIWYSHTKNVYPTLLSIASKWEKLNEKDYTVITLRYTQISQPVTADLSLLDLWTRYKSTGLLCSGNTWLSYLKWLPLRSIHPLNPRTHEKNLHEKVMLSSLWSMHKAQTLTLI